MPTAKIKKFNEYNILNNLFSIYYMKVIYPAGYYLSGLRASLRSLNIFLTFTSDGV